MNFGATIILNAKDEINYLTDLHKNFTLKIHKASSQI